MVDEVAGGFTMAVRRDGTNAIVELGGEFDLHASERLDGGVALAVADAATIDVDANGVTFIDSCGLRALLVARDAARERGAVFRVTGASKQVASVVEIAGVADLLHSAT
jgi:anti-anti-sigma factor